MAKIPSLIFEESIKQLPLDANDKLLVSEFRTYNTHKEFIEKRAEYRSEEKELHTRLDKVWSLAKDNWDYERLEPIDLDKHSLIESEHGKIHTRLRAIEWELFLLRKCTPSEYIHEPIANAEFHLSEREALEPRIKRLKDRRQKYELTVKTIKPVLDDVWGTGSYVAAEIETFFNDHIADINERLKELERYSINHYKKQLSKAQREVEADYKRNKKFETELEKMGL